MAVKVPLRLGGCPAPTRREVHMSNLDDIQKGIDEARRKAEELAKQIDEKLNR